MFSPRVLFLSLLAPLACAAQTGDDPWYFGGSLGLTQVSNLYRVSSAGTRNDDQLRTASLLAGAQLRLGRQRLRADLRADQNQYRRSRDLDYLGFSGSLALDWELGNDLAGTASAGSQRNLASFNPGDRPSTRSKNIERQDRARLDGRYGVFGPWSVEAGLSMSRRDFSVSPDFDPYDLTQRQVDGGVRWRGSPKLTLRLGARSSRTEFPRISRTADGYIAEQTRRNGVEGSVDWQPTAQHSFGLRVGQGRTRFALTPTRSESSTDGRLSWTWLPTARLRLQASYGRDDGSDTRVTEFLPGFSIGSATTRRYDNYGLQLAYALTPKLTLDASLFESRRELLSTSSLSASGLASAYSTRNAGLGLRWAFDRNGLLSCQWNEEELDGQTPFSTPYSARSIGCSVQYLLR